jgi:hypothetical protein
MTNEERKQLAQKLAAAKTGGDVVKIATPAQMAELAANKVLPDMEKARLTKLLETDDRGWATLRENPATDVFYPKTANDLKRFRQ